MLFKKHVIKKLWNFSNLFKILMKNQNLIINLFLYFNYNKICSEKFRKILPKIQIFL